MRLLLVLLCLLFSSETQACSCFSNSNLIERKEKMGTAFVGRVMNMSLDTSESRVKMEFAVDSIWTKGKVKKVRRVVVETNWGSAACGYETSLGERTLLFAYEQQKGGNTVLVTDNCAQNITNPEPSQLDSLWLPPSARKKSKPKKSGVF